FDSQRFVTTLATPPDDRPAMPDQLAGLRLWLRTDRGVTVDANKKIERWADQSGNHFDALQSNPSQRPTLGVISEKTETPVVQFDGQDDFLECTSSLGVQGPADSTVVLLLRLGDRIINNSGLMSLRSSQSTDWTSSDGLAIAQSNDPSGLAVHQYFNRAGANA